MRVLEKFVHIVLYQNSDNYAELLTPGHMPLLSIITVPHNLLEAEKQEMIISQVLTQVF